MRTVSALALVAVVVAGCNFGSSSSGTASSTASASGDDATTLMQLSRDWAKAAASRDVERIVSYWSDDAVLLLPDRAPIIGKAALTSMVQRDMQDPRFSITWEPERAVVAQAGDMAYLIEHNRATFPDPTGKVQTAYGKVVTVWKKDAAGNWKCVVDIANNSATERVLPAE